MAQKTKEPRWGAMTFWERLVRGCEALGKEPPSQADVARLLRIRKSAVTKYTHGGFPKKRNLGDLARHYGLRADWLLDGQGEMVAEESLDPLTLELMRLFRGLDDEAKERVLAAIKYEHAAAGGTSTAKHKTLTEEVIREIERRQGRSSKTSKQ